MIAGVNKMQKENPPELEAFKKRAIKDGLDIISKNRTGGDSGSINGQAAERKRQQTYADWHLTSNQRRDQHLPELSRTSRLVRRKILRSNKWFSQRKSSG
jgi:hypothetical protein